MEALVIISSIIGAAIVLVIDWFIAQEFYQIAQMKGYHDKKYMWLSFLLGAIGYLLVIALPDRGTAATETVVSDELPDL